MSAAGLERNYLLSRRTARGCRPYIVGAMGGRRSDGTLVYFLGGSNAWANGICLPIQKNLLTSPPLFKGEGLGVGFEPMHNA